MSEVWTPSRGDRFVATDGIEYEVTMVRRQSSDRSRFVYVIPAEGEAEPVGHRLEGAPGAGEAPSLNDFVERWLVRNGVAA